MCVIMITSVCTVMDDPCVPVLCLLKALHALSHHWSDLYPVSVESACPHTHTHTHTHTPTHTRPHTQGLAGSPIVPSSEFISSKLTAKTNRQLQGNPTCVWVCVHVSMCLLRSTQCDDL